jgi:hypothetical protein
MTIVEAEAKAMTHLYYRQRILKGEVSPLTSYLKGLD